MRITEDTRAFLLFTFGCVGMLTFGLLMPLLGEGFNLALFTAWAGVAGIGGLTTKKPPSPEEK